MPYHLRAESISCRRGLWPVFRGLSFAIEAGGVLFLTGANGSGKSTLLRTLAGFLSPRDGRISWNDIDIADDLDAHRQRICYVGHQDAVKAELTVAENLSYWRALTGGSNTSNDLFGIFYLADRPVKYLSAGQKRRLALSRLGLNDVPIWLLDEPTTALDAAGRTMLAAAIAQQRRKGGIVIAAMHHELEVPESQSFHLQGAQT